MYHEEWRIHLEDIYEQTEGNGNRSDFVEWITLIDKDQTSQEMFESKIYDLFDVEKYARQMVVEVASGNTDSYSQGTNN